ncbi:MAG: NlpC/P60 family protein [Mycobacteriales bacterium]|nr:NlpC/P60 family protein [Mycobacteriales bacterium]
MPSVRSLRARALTALALCAGLAAGTTAGLSAGPATTDPVPAIVQIAKQQVGDRYELGAEGPDLWDCSGLTSFLWGEVGGVTGMPRVSRDQQRWAVPIPAEQLHPGDLVFYGQPVSHVGLAIGGGRMVDASSSRKGVVERAIWTTGIVRYGRVPRDGMVPVKPWTPTPLSAGTTSPTAPSPTAAPTPAATRPTSGTSTSTVNRPAAVPAPVVPLKGLPGVQKVQSSAVMTKAAANARSVLGSTAWTDVELVRVAWRHAGGGVLPADRRALVAASRPVALPDARVGDLVVYGAPAEHVGIYLGHGYMVDSSKVLGRVVVRRVFASPTVRLVRPPVVTTAPAKPAAKPAASSSPRR